MKQALLLSLAALLLLPIAAIGQSGPPPNPGGGGNITACGDAPGGDPSVEINGGSQSTGNISVTSVKINGVTIDASKYTVNNNGTSSPEVVFHAPDPGAPASGDNVCVYGTTATGDQEFEGELNWRD